MSPTAALDMSCANYVLLIIIIISIIIFIRTQNEQIIQKIDGTVQQILKIKGE